MKNLTLIRSVFGFAVCAMFAATGCNRPSPHEHGPAGHTHTGGDGTDEEERTSQITIWSDQYEIFAEHKAPIAGKPTRFITHVTEIKTGEPRRSGMIQFVMEQGDARIEHPQAAPERAGIYVPAITFPREGDWKAKVIIPGDSDAVVELGTIKVFANKDAAARAEFPEPPEGISFLKEQQWRILTKHERTEKRTLIERIPLHATVMPAPGSKVMIHPQITGTLVMEKGTSLGTRVKAGDILGSVRPAFGEFSSKLIDAEADAIRTKAGLEQAQTSFERTKRLFDQQAKSERELKEAEVAFRTAQASYEAAAAVQALYKGTGTTFENGTVRIGMASPIDGVIDRVLAAPGARVTPEDPVFSIVNSAAAWVQARAPEARIADIDSRLGGRFTPVGSRSSGYSVKFLAMGQEIDASTRTAPLTFEFEKAEPNVSLGAVGILHVGSKKAVESIAVSKAAVVEEDGIPVVFVQVSGETYQKRDVALGVRDGNWIEVKSGLAEGERVATEGAYTILLSTKSGTIPAHGHAH